jgi:hypothetical protein
MSQALIAAVAAGALAGGGVVAAVHMLSAPEPQVAVESQAAAPGAQGDLALQVQQLVEEQRGLVARLEMLEARPAASAPARSAIADPNLTLSDAEVDELRELIEASAALRQSETPVDLESLDTVRSAMEVIEAEREAERDAERAARMEERRAEMVAELAEQLGLDDFQTEQLGRLYSERDAEFAAVREQMFELDDRDLVRDMFTEVRERYDEQMKNLFTDAQYEQYEELGNNRRGGFGGGFGGFGGGRGGR